jgi:hypothetical protein
MRIETGTLFCFFSSPARLPHQNTTTAESPRVYAQRGEPLELPGVCPKKYSNLRLNVSAPAGYM